jgi:hypothetical protein
MAQLHFAYCFDPIAFALPFAGFAGQSADQLPARLKNQALAAVDQPTATLHEALIAVRYCSDWLGNDPEEADLTAKAFLLCLLAQCVAVPSLGRQNEPPHHVVLKALLVDAGWDSPDIDSLLRGDDLSSYLDDAGLESLSPLLTGLDDLGGWLGYQRAKKLEAELAKVEAYFEREVKSQETILAGIYPPWRENAGSMAKQAYRRAQSMLNEVSNPHRALFLILD